MKIALSFFALIFSMSMFSQESQTIRGIVLDGESLMSLPGAYIVVRNQDPQIGTATDLDGNFKLNNIHTGRISLVVTMIGYDERHLDNILLTSGKQLVLEIQMMPSFEQLDEAVISAGGERGEAMNEMATVSARSFSVEETQRYAGSAFDPSRMASNFAGVVSAGNDILNEISVRGNSPRGILWRLEGIEIPNPNHFGSLGSSGGGISMMSSSTLSGSDFYTAGFPAEFGDATSGVFDINFRNGNSEIREYSFMVGALGIEASAEGYLSPNKQDSYLINYRYSTLAILSTVYQPLGDALPAYQDLSFKINLPETKFGSLAFFGLGGINVVDTALRTDSAEWGEEVNYDDFSNAQQVGTLGVKHTARISNKAYLQTTAAFSANRYTDESTDYSPELVQPELYDVTTFLDDQIGFHSSLNYKIDNRNTLKVGLIYSHNLFHFKYDSRDDDTNDWVTFINKKGSSNQLSQYAQWKHRLSEQFTALLGVHSTYVMLNDKYSIEPRAAFTYLTPRKNKLSLALGLHSKPEHVSTYFIGGEASDNINTKFNDLEIPKSWHGVLGYTFNLSPKTIIVAEAYYQHQFDVSVEGDSSSYGSILNVGEIWELMGVEKWSGIGTGQNYGLDLSVQRALSNDYYFMANISIYKSVFQTFSGKTFNSRYNGDYVINLLGGKEWKLKNENKRLGVNLKILASGGNRTTPIDKQQSILEGRPVYHIEQMNTAHVGSYWRFDVGMSYKINRPKSTHTLLIDVQNVTNRANVQGQYYDSDDQEVRNFYQTGLFPFINYRIEFQGKLKARL